MNEERTPIEEIIRNWKDEVGESRTSERGTTYKIVPSNRMLESLVSLAQTLLDAGYSYKEFNTARVAETIAKICWKENKIIKMSVTEVKKAQSNTVDDWFETISATRFSGLKVSEVKIEKPAYVAPVAVAKKEESREKTKEELMEEILNPKGRIVGTKIDRSKDTNWELLAELGIEPDETK